MIDTQVSDAGKNQIKSRALRVRKKKKKTTQQTITWTEKKNRFGDGTNERN